MAIIICFAIVVLASVFIWLLRRSSGSSQKGKLKLLFGMGVEIENKSDHPFKKAGSTVVAEHEKHPKLPCLTARQVQRLNESEAKRPKQPPQDADQAGSFGTWLKNIADNRRLTNIKWKDEFIMVQDCLILDSARSPHGYASISLDPVEPALIDFPQIAKQDRAEWQKQRDNLRVSGLSAMVTQFCPGLTEDNPRLQYCVIDYASGIAFLELLKSPRILERYRDQALAVRYSDDENILRIHPNILSTGIVVIVGDTEPLIVIAHRRKRSGSPDGNVWSVSVAEQFKPKQELREGRKIGPDKTVEDSAWRGVLEELLGENCDLDRNSIKFAFHSFAMMEKLFYFFAAVVDLRPMSFDDLTKRWQSDSTIDKGEHCALAAIPFNANVLKTCIESEFPPRSVRRLIEKRHLIAFEPGLKCLPDAAWVWQPSSHLRLALAQWYLESAK